MTKKTTLYVCAMSNKKNSSFYVELIELTANLI